MLNILPFTKLIETKNCQKPLEIDKVAKFGRTGGLFVCSNFM